MSNNRFNWTKVKFSLNGSQGSLENCFVFQFVLQNVSYSLGMMNTNWLCLGNEGSPLHPCPPPSFSGSCMGDVQAVLECEQRAFMDVSENMDYHNIFP